MKTFNAILEPGSDGNLHVPIPPELKGQKIRIIATLTAVTPESADGHEFPGKGFGSLKGKIWMAPDFNEPLEDFKEYME